MNKYRVTVFHPEPVQWEGEAVNCMDANILARAAADPVAWAAYERRPASSNVAPSWGLFRRESDDLYGYTPITCKIERIG